MPAAVTITGALPKGLSVKDVSQHEFVRSFSAFLKKSGKLKVPEWADVVKLGGFNELAPCDHDWFYTRSASISRHLYIRSPTGVGALTKIYSGKKRTGSQPSHYCRGSGSVARKALQALEQSGYVRKSANGGRELTPAAQRDMDRIAQQVAQRAVQQAAEAAAAASAVVVMMAAASSAEDKPEKAAGGGGEKAEKKGKKGKQEKQEKVEK